VLFDFDLSSFHMMKNLVLLFLIPSVMCAGQSVLTTPAQFGQSASGISSAQVPAHPQMQNQTVRIPAVGATVQDFDNSSVEAPEEYRSSSRIVGPLRTRSEFERFVEDATGRQLPVYGRQLFDEVPTTFSPMEDVPVPAHYVVGPGDQLLIRVWGKIELDSRVTVDRNGQIYLPKIGTLNVAGLRYDQVEGYLHSAIGAIFKDFELNVALGQLRSIQIYVLGDARQPGAYTVSSLSTLVDALFASGGPSAIGTMRRIQLRRQGRTVSEFDLYDVVRKGDKSHDIRLLPGDVIYIPPAGAQIAISGDVNQPGIYELKGETTVSAALQYAGGVTNLADTERAVLEQVDNHSSRRIDEFTLDASGLQRPLKDGDLLRIFPVSPKFENAVTLRGNVAQPGIYPWKPGMRISDLIPSRGFLITREYWNRQNHLIPRASDHEFGNPRLNRFDNSPADQFGGAVADQHGNSSADNSAELSADQYGESRHGPYRNPPSGTYDDSSNGAYGNSPAEQVNNSSTSQYGFPSRNEYGNSRTDLAGSQRMPLIDTIGQNSAEINWDYALIERLDQHDLSTRLIPFRLADAIDNPASPDNRLLKAGDVVTIFSGADLKLPTAKRASFVRVSGEVNTPGVYRIKPGDTLRDVVEQAGGLTQHSYLYASVLTRVSTRLAQERELRESADQMQKELIAKFANATPKAGQSEADQQAQLAMQQAALAKLTSIRPIGRVVLEMKPDASTIAAIPDFPLEDGDTFYVPPMPGTVQVSGAVYNASAFRFQPGKRLIAYLAAAGGPTREADKNRIFVIRADGDVISRQSHGTHTHGKFENLRLLPGDAIIVPEKITISSKMNNILQATQLTSQTALTAAALSVIH
jgi:protein involved in polysaccharide export with SLBB domain